MPMPVAVLLTLRPETRAWFLAHLFSSKPFKTEQKTPKVFAVKHLTQFEQWNWNGLLPGFGMEQKVNPRTPIEELELAGSNNLRRALRRQEADANVPAPKNAVEEVAQLDVLIAQCLRACARGQIFRGKRNPAFQNLAELARVRRMVMERGGVAPNKSTEDVLAAANKLLGVN